MRVCRIVGVVVLAAACVSTGRAAEDEKPSAARGPEVEAFYRIQSEMNALLAEMANLQIRYRTANDEKQSDIKLQWKELAAKGEKLEMPLIEAAKKAYLEAPNKDKGIVAFLILLLAQDVQKDNFEPAAAIGKLLMDNGCEDKRVPNLAGIAAFATNDFDGAERYLKTAAENGDYKELTKENKLGLTGAGYLLVVDKYKPIWEKERALRESETSVDNLPRVLLKTTKGDIVIELFENQAPNTVANFLTLVNKGFYKGLSFHRVLENFMAQGGDPKGDGTGGPGYSIPCECYRPDYRHHFRGSLSMAHAGRDTGGSQFFLTFVPTPQLDGMHTVFGRVIEGMDVLAKLQRRDPSDKEAPRADKIIEAQILRKRPHEYEVKKMPE